MDGSKTRILNPTGMRKPSKVRLAARPENLEGLTVGLLDQGRWATWTMVSQHYKQLLKERYGVEEVVHVNQEEEGLHKGTSWQRIHEDLASKCDAVIIGLGN